MNISVSVSSQKDLHEWNSDIEQNRKIKIDISVRANMACINIVVMLLKCLSVALQCTTLESVRNFIITRHQSIFIEMTVGNLFQIFRNWNPLMNLFNPFLLCMDYDCIVRIYLHITCTFVWKTFVFHNFFLLIKAVIFCA